MSSEKMLSEDKSFNDMPLEVVLRIFSLLTPGMLFSIRETSKIFHYVFELLDTINENNIDKLYPALLEKIPQDVQYFWHQWFLRNFGHRLGFIKTEFKETCWPLEYIKYAIQDYKDVPKIARLLISFVKIGDVKSIQALFDHDPNNPPKLFPQFQGLEKFTIAHFLITDNAHNSALKLLMNRQSFLKKNFPQEWQATADCVFKFICNNYLSYTDRSSSFLIKCAAQLNQPKKVFDELIIKEFITREELKNCLDDAERSALHFAAASGNLAAVVALVELGCDVNKQAEYKTSALYEACAGGNYSVVKYLLEHGGEESLNIHNTKNGHTPHLIAVANGHLNIVQYLHTYHKNDKSCNINAVTDKIQTAIHIAAYENHVYLLNYLLNNGCLDQINKLDTHKNTPLICAVQYQNIEAIIMLLENNADVNFAKPNGLTALSIAAKNGFFDIVKTLVNKRAKINLDIENSRLNPLVAAAEDGYVNIVEYLVENGADNNQIKKAMKHRNTCIESLSVLIDKKPELIFDVGIFNRCLPGLNTSVLSIASSSKIVQYENIKFFPAKQPVNHSKINAFISLAIQHEIVILNDLIDTTEKNDFKQIKEIFTLLEAQIKAGPDKPFEDIVKSLNLNQYEIPQNFSKFIDYLISVSKEYTAKPAVQLSSLYAQYSIFGEEKMYCSSVHVGNIDSANHDNSSNYPQQKMW